MAMIQLFFRVAALASLITSAVVGNGAFAQGERSACDAAATSAELVWNVPAGVLSAVGTVESGRRGGELGPAPWPWTINAAGHGAWFATKEEAIAAVLAVMGRGYPYIDVGCFQIDLAYHPGVFRSLDEAFDPARNAQAAAQILASEHARSGDWGSAVARYHSATPSLGGPYLDRVRAALPLAKLRGTRILIDTSAPAPDPAALPQVVYPVPIRFGGTPQVIYLGPATALPKVVAGSGLSHVAATPQGARIIATDTTISSKNVRTLP